MRLTWAQPEDLVAAELVALREQGVDEAALAPLARRWSAAGGSTELLRAGASEDPASSALRELAREVLDELAHLQVPSADEPDGWEDVVARLPGAQGPVTSAPPAFDRVHGAWLGRAAGCLLGKPVEKLPRTGIEAIARSTGNWPIRGYFTAVGLPDDVAVRWPWNRRSAPTSLAENIDGMPEDDDLNFPVLGLGLLETHGDALETEHVAEAWLAQLPAGRVFTAERAAYRNLLDARPVPSTATHHNPFREWIGALIRADVHGWAHPGDVRAAARSAWADARLSHSRNGIYGALWGAALCSASLVAASADEVLDAAGTVVPPASRLARAVSVGRDVGRRLRAGELQEGEALDELHAAYGGLHWVHTLNNAALVACALQAHGDDVVHAVALAVSAGWDTDSVGATVGSVVGALVGARALPADWTEPLRDSLATTLPEGPRLSLHELARRTHALAGAPA